MLCQNFVPKERHPRLGQNQDVHGHSLKVVAVPLRKVFQQRLVGRPCCVPFKKRAGRRSPEPVLLLCCFTIIANLFSGCWAVINIRVPLPYLVRVVTMIFLMSGQKRSENETENRRAE